MKSFDTFTSSRSKLSINPIFLKHSEDKICNPLPLCLFKYSKK